MNARFDVTDTDLPGLKVLERKPIGDSRGFFERLFCSSELAGVFGGGPIVQINHTLTRDRGVVRGMHFQHPPHAEIKLVSCLHGEVFDVAIDLRRGSPTFMHWHAEVLSEKNHRSLAIPMGFAHGFQTLTDDCEMLYLHSAAHHPPAEGGIHPADPRIAVEWPLEIREMSGRDASRRFLDEMFFGIEL